ncbi:MAG: sensor histidine kinase [Saprospiraceae bacterium]
MSKILIIDDDKKILFSFGHRLKKNGFDVWVAESASVGLDVLCKNTVDLILLDYAMPNINGLEAFNLIKKQLLHRCPPVIMMTFNTDYKIATRFIQAGGADFIEKSINPEELKVNIQKIIQQRLHDVTEKGLQKEKSVDSNQLLLEKIALLKLKTIALEKSNQELKNFVDIIAHDLREPLRNISNSLQFLKWDFEKEIDKKAGEYIEFAIKGAVRLSNMIQGLTYYSNVNSVLPFKNVNVLEIIVDNQIPTIIIAHQYQLIQLFQNLISNAIKFKKATETPVIIIRSQELPNHWQFSVTDNGIGFNETYKHRIFNLFQRLHILQGYQGSGVGLSICQKIVERHNGQISATSEEGKGTTFTFTISKNL